MQISLLELLQSEPTEEQKAAMRKSFEERQELGDTTWKQEVEEAVEALRLRIKGLEKQ